MSTASDELADRIRAELSDRHDIDERRMFGGVGFMLAGNLCAAAQRNGNLMLRIDPETAGELTADPHANLMVMRGREMRGWVTVDPGGIDDDKALRDWLQRGVEFASGLPPK